MPSQSVLGNLLSCTQCRLHETRTQVVPGMGNYESKIALIGEAPGKDEDEQGLPFIGRAGKHLDNLMAKVGLDRTNVWLDNAVHCRPPMNRIRDYPDAQALCPTLWLYPILEQMPNLKVIVPLGATAGILWFPGKKATEMANLARQLKSGVTVVGAFHPSYAMRQGEWVDQSIISSLTRALIYANIH